MIPITVVKSDAETEALVLEVVRSGQYAQGEYVARLEQAFADAHGVRHAVAVNNGTTALVAALQALEIGPGDEVITTPFTFVATLNAILEAGATARFADIGDDFNIDASKIRGLIGPATKAIMPVHLYGLVADMDPITELAEEHELAIVEDAAQAVGATLDGRAAGSFGLGCFSLYATKNISTGEGGMITTSDDALADRLRILRNQGMRARYQYELAGHNYRMTNIAAAIGLPQMARLEEINDARARNAARLRDGLLDVPGIVPPPDPGERYRHVYHQFTIRVTEEAGITRDGFVEALQERGVGCGVYYPKVVFDYDCYRDHPRVVTSGMPNAHRAADEVVSLPVHPYLSDSDIATIVAAVRSAVNS